MKIDGKMITRCQVAIFLLCLFLGSGCSKQKLPDDMPKLYPCKITIKDKDGKPMPTVVVSLNPEDKDNRWGASGETNASGVAVILTSGQYPGLAQGKYRVTLTRLEHVKTGELNDAGNEIILSKNLILEEYSNLASTPFQFAMETKATTLTFQLEK